MSRVENLVKRIFEFQKASADNLITLQHNKTFASMLDKVLSRRYSADFGALVERMTRVLMRISSLRITTYVQEVPPIRLPEQTLQGAEMGGVEPPLQPLRFTITRGLSPINSIIRRVVRSFRVERGEKAAEEEPPEPKAGPKKAMYTIQGYSEKVAAGLPVLIPIPPRRGFRPEPVRPGYHPKAPREGSTVASPIPQPGTLPESQYGGVSEKVDLQVSETISKALKPVPEFVEGRPPGPSEPRLEPEVSVEPVLQLAGAAVSPGGRPPKIGGVSQMVYDLSRWAARMRSKTVVVETSVVETLMEERSRIVDAVSQRIVEHRDVAAFFDWRPSILAAIGISSKRVLHDGRREILAPGIGASWRPTVSAVTGEALSIAPEDIPSIVSPVFEREAEGRAALVASEVGRVSRQLAEKLAETYREGAVSLAPTRIRALAGGLLLAPSLGGLAAKKIGSAFKTIGAMKALSEEALVRGRGVNGVHPLEDYLAMATRLSGISDRDGLEAVWEEDGELIKMPPHPLKEYLALATKYTKDGLDGFDGLLDSVGEGVNGFAATALGLMSASIDSIIPGVAEDGMGAFPGAAWALDSLNVVSEILSKKVEAEGVVKGYMDGLVDGLVEAPAVGVAPLSVALEAPMAAPSVKLQEIVPILSRATAPLAEARGPPSFRRERVADRIRPIEVRVESKMEDIDLRELERKIARILREEARRYGVY